MKTRTICLLALGLLLLCSTGAFAQQGGAVGWVTSIQGKVLVGSANSGADRAVLQLGQEIFNGMTLETTSQSAVRILFKGDNVLTLSQNTRITVTRYVSSPQKNTSQFDLLWGRIRAAVNQKILVSRGDVFEIRTKNAVAGVRGSVIGVDYDPKQNRTSVGCGSGSCYYGQNGGNMINLPAGFWLNLNGSQAGSPQPLGPEDPGSYDPEMPFGPGDGVNIPPDPPANGAGGNPNEGAGGQEGSYFNPFLETFGASPDFDPVLLDLTQDGPGTIYENFQNDPPNPSGGNGQTVGPGE